MHFMCKITDGFPFFSVEQTLDKTDPKTEWAAALYIQGDKVFS